MKRRYHLRNNAHMIESLPTEQGLARLKLIRSTYAEFKGRHIRDVIQAYPSQIQPLKYYQLS